ncbi:YdeI/OmpD-associated family protein [Rudaea sp.]|uniref:YdeI/OmpD-associated family protein n=1 Tax=Rudaea sp. TaxID=2136325 RepID=UPI002ED674F3
MKKNGKATATFAAFSPSCKREYIEWIAEAKREETRAKRVAQAVEWMAEGKQRNWKYQQC